MLKQTQESAEYSLMLRTQGGLFNAGSFENLVFAHDVGRQVAFSIRFPSPAETPTELEPVGAYPPRELHLSFQKGAEGKAELSRFALHDVHGREMVVRVRQSDGHYSLQVSNPPPAGSLFEKVVREVPPFHFMFTSQHFWQARFSEEQERPKKEPSDAAEAPPVTFEKGELDYTSALGFASEQIQSLLDQLSYIGPLRERPRRLYEVSGQTPRDVGSRGQSAPEILFRHRAAALIGDVNRWMQAFDFGFTLDCRELVEGAFDLRVRRTPDSPWVNLADTGFGLSQVLPLIVQSYYSAANGLIVAEQPEIHLNPRLQSVLADLFADVTKRKVSVLVETHSEHLVLRVRRLVAEGTIQAKDVALYYVERDGDRSAVRPIPISTNGHIEPTNWPRGFFDDSLREALALSSAQNRPKNAS